VDVDAVVKEQKHLSVEQWAKLLNIFHKQTKLLSGKLGLKGMDTFVGFQISVN
jgi:hypothetical protein